ncbi:unnamed protein product [Heterobilharzia americana]|nr:unnamed protein product [Heterobilharzia americana]
MHGSCSTPNSINYEASKSLSKEKRLESELGSSVALSHDTLGVEDNTSSHCRSKNTVRLSEPSDVQYNLASDLTDCLTSIANNTLPRTELLYFDGQPSQY